MSFTDLSGPIDMPFAPFQANEARLSAVIETALDAFVGIDAQGRITDWNRQAELIFGWTRQQALGQAIASLIMPERFLGSHAHGLAHFHATGQGPLLGQRTNTFALRANGEEFPIEMTITALRQGEEYSFFAFVHDISERMVVEEKLLNLTRHDHLTALPNRSFFHERLQEAMARAKRTRRPMALMFIDIDHFKSINDSLGHDAGDELLKGVAARLKASVREVDLVARLGGDEFTVLMEDLHNIDDAAGVARKIIENLSAPFELKTHLRQVTASIGIASYEGDRRDDNELIVQADQAMYRSKKSGRNTFRVFMDALMAQPPTLQTDPAASQPGAVKRRTLVDLMAFPVTPGPDAARRFMAEALEAVREHLGMDVAFVSEFTQGRRVFRQIDTGGAASPISVGGGDDLEGSYCQRVIDGRLPELIPDAFGLPEAMALPATAALPVRAHISVPVRLDSGLLYGTFCCFSSTADQSLNERDLKMMRLFAELIGRLIQRETSQALFPLPVAAS